MAKIEGKDLEFWYDSEEVPVISANLTSAFDTLDGTDSATPGDGKDTEVARADRTFTIEAFMYDPDGTEIATGSLTAGTRYRVTLGTISETQGDFTVGMLFESDGTGTASSSNKVKPLGSRVDGKDMALTFDSSSVAVTDVDFNLTYDELDSTDSETTGDGKDTSVSRADRETAITGIMRDTEADLLTTSPVKKATTLTFNTNTTVAGYMLPISKNITDSVQDMSKIDYSFKWWGQPTETNMGLTAGESKAIKIILKRGSSSNKEYTGTAVITAKSASANIVDLAKITYTFHLNGAMTEHVYS